MQQDKIAVLQSDQDFLGFLLVKRSDSRINSKGAPYLDMTLTDNTGDINAKVWNTAEPVPQAGTVIKVAGRVVEYNGRNQLRVDRYRDSTLDDEVDLSELVSAAPRPADEMMDEVLSSVEEMTNPVLKPLVSQMLTDVGGKIMHYPAAQSLHHAERSGLLHHITSMLATAKALCGCYPFLDRDLVIAGVIVHDLSKLSEMIANDMGSVTDYSREGMLIGHLVRGVSVIRQTAVSMGIDPEEEYVMLLEHMVISHHRLPEYGSPRAPMFPEADILHYIDVIDAHMNQMRGVLSRVPQGNFSDTVWSLNNIRLYHPRYFRGEE